MNKLIRSLSIFSKSQLAIGGLSAIFLISGFSYALFSKYKMEKKPAYTKGVVINIDKRLKGGWFAYYKFIIDTHTYKGSARYYPDFQEINIGDTCYVIYEHGDPSNNNLTRLEEDRRYYKIRKPYKSLKVIFEE